MSSSPPANARLSSATLLGPTCTPIWAASCVNSGRRLSSLAALQIIVHVLMQAPADLAVADCLRVLKTNSSRWVKGKWPERRSFGWQSGYGAFSVSESNRANVIRYIQGQEQHHCQVSFQDEFLGLLRKHGVEFDERYIWG